MPKRLFEHPILVVEGFDVRTRSGSAEYIRIRTPDWVNVVAITADDHLVLVRQHRWGIDASTLEIPGGVVDPGEDAAQAALRELREETGYDAPTLTPLGWVWSNPAIQSNRTWMFLARGAWRAGPPRPDEGEEIAVELHPLSAVPNLLFRGEIRHALAVVALQRVLLGPTLV